jgi:hypothetical protein
MKVTDKQENPRLLRGLFKLLLIPIAKQNYQ